MSNQHVLKIHPAPLADLLSGAKAAEVRRNDRGFQVGDTVRLMEVNPETLNWTGRPDLVRTISHIQTGYGLPEGMCVLSYAQAEQQGAQAGDEQDQFEAWHRSVVAGDPPHEKYHDGSYVNQHVNRYWTGWQARAALATQPAAGEPQTIGYANPKHLASMAAGTRAIVPVLPSICPGLGHTEPVYGAPPAAAHGDEAVRKDATESAIHRACKELPEGWSMQIELERGAGDVTLFNAWDIVVDFGKDFESSISAQVEAAIDAAMRAQGDGETRHG